MTTLTEMPTYEAYKDSGVDWIGEVPESWDISRLGAVFEERRTKVSDIDYPPLSVTKNGILPQLDNAAKTKDGDNRKLVLTGDFVINSRSDRKGSSGVSCLDGSVSLINIVLKPKRINPSFCNHLLKCNAFIEEYYRVGRGIVADLWTTRYDEMRTMMLALPSLNEQTAIANFLDEKTAKIDEAIAIKEKQIELLKERKQIIIQQAVTQGLDPTVPMKESGVEWIGKIPAHWEIMVMKNVINDVGDVDHYMPQSIDMGIPYLMTGDLKEFVSNINFENCKQVSYRDYLRLSKKIKTTKGDVILARYATIGTAAYVDIENEFLVSYSCVTIKPNVEKMLGLYLFQYFKSQSFLQEINDKVNTNTQGNVGISDLRKVKIPLPTIKEQLEIIEFIKDKINKADGLIALQSFQIEKLKEYKTTLINSAVTGKIKVV